MLLYGKCISPGVAQGDAFIINSKTPLLTATSIPSVQSANIETERFHAAVSRAKSQLEQLLTCPHG